MSNDALVSGHRIASREEWLSDRLELLKAEKELTHRSDELARQRQALPWVRIDKEYRFDAAEGSASLTDLFKGRSQLLVYHLMFGADYTGACPSCSSFADGFNGFAVHLAHHDVMLMAVSRAPLAKLQAYKRRMGWTFPWASSFGSDFTTTREKPEPHPGERRMGRVPGSAARARSRNSPACVEPIRPLIYASAPA